MGYRKDLIMSKSGRKQNNPNYKKNLIQFDQMTPEQRTEMARKGAAASNKRQQQARDFKEAVRWLMSETKFSTENDAILALREKFPDITMGEAMAASVMQKVIEEGDARGFSVIRDTSGEIPAQNVNLSNNAPMTINIKTVE